MRRPRESVAEAVGTRLARSARPWAWPAGLRESAKNPQDTKAARGNREPYNDDRNLKYALRLYLHHLLSILAGRQVTRLSSGSNLISSDPRPDPRRGQANPGPARRAARISAPSTGRLTLKRFTPRTSTPRTARPCPQGFQGPQVRPSQPHRATCQEGVGIEQTQSTRVHTCQQQHGWAALIRRRSKHGWAALIRRRSSCAERANSAESARENHNREASRPALPNGLQIRVRLAIAIRE